MLLNRIDRVVIRSLLISLQFLQRLCSEWRGHNFILRFGAFDFRTFCLLGVFRCFVQDFDIEMSTNVGNVPVDVASQSSIRFCVITSGSALQRISWKPKRQRRWQFSYTVQLNTVIYSTIKYCTILYNSIQYYLYTLFSRLCILVLYVKLNKIKFSLTLKNSIKEHVFVTIILQLVRKIEQ